jgi:hypothetical protein
MGPCNCRTHMLRFTGEYADIWLMPAVDEITGR